MPTATAGKQRIAPYLCWHGFQTQGEGVVVLIKNFDIWPIVYAQGDDPEVSTVWRFWWDGREPKFPTFLAHQLWWAFTLVSDSFISPDEDWNPPSEYIIIDEDFATPARNIEQDMLQYFERLETFSARDGTAVGDPYDFEYFAAADDFLSRNLIRATAIYIVYCIDKAVTGLLTEDAGLSASAVAYAFTAMNMLSSTRMGNSMAANRNNVTSENGRRAANFRHQPTRAMKKEAVRLYIERVEWPSRRQAARVITPLVQSYGMVNYRHQLSADRAEQTVYEWLSEHGKSLG